MIRTIAPPANEPVSVEELKAQCRIEHDEENKLLKRYIVAARTYAESVMNYKVIRQKLTVCRNTFSDPVKLSIAPVQSVDRIGYYDPDNVFTVLEVGNYRTAISDAYTVITPVTSWPAISATMYDAVQFDLTVGPAQADELHKQAILMLAAGWYKSREDISALDFKNVPNGAMALLNTTNNQVF
jgi:uncharacterized phiE125 gp8 family phage protein